MTPAMRFGADELIAGATICSGIGAPEQAMPWVNWKWCAEIERFPSAVLAQRHPQTVNFGDVTAKDFIVRALKFGPLGILVAGTPCQSFSVAGLRKSMADSRGNLTLRLVEILHAIKPSCLLWENVPGVLSTPDNAFGCFLAGLVGADEPIAPAAKWSRAGVVAGPLGTAAWRVLDAQYFGLAQRRERVFLVFCFGDTTDPAEILFEFEGMRRDYPPSREAREGITGTISARTQGGGGLGTDFDLGGGLQVARSCHVSQRQGGGGRIDGESETFITAALDASYGKLQGCSGQDANHGHSHLITHSLRADGFDASEDGTGRGTPLVAVSDVREVGIYHCGDCGEEYAALGSTDPSSPRVQLDGFMLLANSCPNCGGHGDTVSYPAGSFGAHAERSGIADSLRSHPRPGSNSLGAVTATPILEAGARTGKSTTDIRAGIGIGEPGDPMYTLQSGKQHAIGVIPLDMRQASCGEKMTNNRRPGTTGGAPGTGIGESGDPCPTIANSHVPAIAFSSKDHGADAGEISPTLRSMDHDGSHANGGGQVAVAISGRVRGDDGRGYARPEQVSDIPGALDTVKPPRIATSMAVRRLTPTECERLQGFPDDYTLIPVNRFAKLADIQDQKQKLAADSPRYKALGNSMAVPCIAWIGNRIRTQLQKRKPSMNDRDALLLDIFKAMREEPNYDRRNRLYVLAEAMLTEPEEQTVEETRVDLVALLGAVR